MQENKYTITVIQEATKEDMYREQYKNINNWDHEVDHEVEHEVCDECDHIDNKLNEINDWFSFKSKCGKGYKNRKRRV